MSATDLNNSSLISGDKYEDGLVTIILTSSHDKPCVQQAIQSLIDQTVQRYEIISTGCTISNQIKHQAAPNLNDALQQATGEFITLMDADHILQPNFIEKLMSELQGDPTVDGVYCGYRFIDEEGGLLKTAEVEPVTSEQLSEALQNGNCWVPESFLLRRACFVSAGRSGIGQVTWWQKVLSGHQILGVPDALVGHRIRSKRVGQPENGAKFNKGAIYGQVNITSAIEYLQLNEVEQAYGFFAKAAELSPNFLTQVSTYYEMACSSQPKEQRGDLTLLDFDASSAQLIEFLNRLFKSSNEIGQNVRQEAFGIAYYTLGMMAYNGRKNGLSRSYLRQALQFDRNLLTSPDYGRLFLKTMVHPQFADFVKSIKS